MKFGPRRPSLKRSLKARTTGRAKRAIKRSVNPLYGKKGMGWVNNPKKAAYNKVYNKTTFSVFNPPKGSSGMGCLGALLLLFGGTNNQQPKRPPLPTEGRVSVQLPTTREGLTHRYIFYNTAVLNKQTFNRRLPYNEVVIIEILNHCSVKRLTSTEGVGKITANKIMNHRPYSSYQEVLERPNGFGEVGLRRFIEHVDNDIRKQYKSKTR